MSDSAGQAEVIPLLRALVRAESPSGAEEPAVALLAGWLAERGLAPRRDGRNVWCEVGPADAPTLLLCSHLDTVPVGEGWTRPPLTAHQEGERIYGRGSNDAKGCVAAMAGALLDLRAEARDDVRVVLAATVEEETGRPGGLPDLLPRLPVAGAAVVGEPTGLVPVHAQKGLLALEAVASGKAAHAARPEEGLNAVHLAARAIVALEQLRFPRVHPELGPPTVQVTVVRGGERRNVIPATCELSLDVRTTPDYTPEELTGLLRDALPPGVELTVRSLRLRARSTPRQDPIIRAAVEVTGSASTGSPTVSDWALLGEVAAVKLGPGESPRSHTADEYVTEGELRRGVAVYAGLARRWAALARA